ncbi:(deoxy)nucleoside triphosphate pyrophosphohydrolase [Reinekea blandensis]|uniref:8-oxo-dGTP diphosphatase n=1 Tax=Reinekea blandensis MED297 TaxID=314283 RepID=A4BD91_9GAMM|nr:(deoxy)nucleoside triphosphate pyrophosphohydrolase [Reinekea blandensis]EAR09835.1 NTP pyrophosphohydrolase [Reinekea sp. MED297] [Reinekea blandensis MED297]
MSEAYPHNVLPVVAGILVSADRVLCARKAEGTSMAGCWEFPGGKIETGETPELALHRELKEELGIIADIGDYFADNHYVSNDRTLHLMAYWVTRYSGEFTLTDHDALHWSSLSGLSDLNWAPADIPIVDKLKEIKRFPQV